MNYLSLSTHDSGFAVGADDAVLNVIRFTGVK